MSEENWQVKAFLYKLGEDKELQEKIKGADSDEKFFAVAKSSGFDFTKEEWLAVIIKQNDEEGWRGCKYWLGVVILSIFAVVISLFGIASILDLFGIPTP